MLTIWLHLIPSIGWINISSFRNGRITAVLLTPNHEDPPISNIQSPYSNRSPSLKQSLTSSWTHPDHRKGPCTPLHLTSCHLQQVQRTASSSWAHCKSLLALHLNRMRALDFLDSMEVPMPINYLIYWVVKFVQNRAGFLQDYDRHSIPASLSGRCTFTSSSSSTCTTFFALASLLIQLLTATVPEIFDGYSPFSEISSGDFWPHGGKHWTQYEILRIPSMAF